MNPTRAGVVAMVAFAASAGCDPTPDYPPLEPGTPGMILAEHVVVAPADAPLELVWDEVTLSLPAGAVPAGTRVTIRLLIDVHKDLRSDVPVLLWKAVPGAGAVELLPETLALASPGTLTFNQFPDMYDVKRGLTTVDALFAGVTEVAWRRRGRAVVSPPHPFYGTTTTTISIDRGGLWSLALDLTPTCGADGGCDASAPSPATEGGDGSVD